MSEQRKNLNDIPYSVLDLAPVTEYGAYKDALNRTRDLAQHVEALGYNRFWLAEHHNMPFIASSATSVVIGHVAAGTSTLRVGSGGIMLPNHAPLVIAEQFGTLESLFPGRIDLGLGRAPGTDQRTAFALRRGQGSMGQDFPELLAELRSYFDPSLSGGSSPVRAVPGEGLDIPTWLLGSSLYSAQLAGELGLPYSFASHFSPKNTIPALRTYREHFKPSKVLDKPYAMVGVNVIVADTDEEANYLATTLQQQFLNLIRNHEAPMQPPVEKLNASEYELAALDQQLATSIIGSPETVQRKLQEFLDETQADEMMVISSIYDHDKRKQSYKLLSDITK
ncbi:LLM class flavin-dependent oxidoreductase [Pseudalkalibacillus hwajinpoensis]|uniref:LLM class flavin-dependent oxidoreductase n=1 Tax=Guptibacillus hwajinpoensis TaxID=208199 RepID=A0A4U1MKY7_9BACL|nr:LLM class flavin-dependent oxidoreductase [Pseudalkalibacillus hwajinpoensis]TKD71344.1 LLM class flavin-dependent oxidoreductase [Pseudalkalibacillus hwajinpoensis]